MDKLIGACGLVCSECEALRATLADDLAELQKVADKWRKEYGNPSITADGVVCDGCMAQTDRHCFHCAECEIRACAMAKGYETCAPCPDYGCSKLAGLFAMVPQAKRVLDTVRSRSA